MVENTLLEYLILLREEIYTAPQRNPEWYSEFREGWHARGYDLANILEKLILKHKPKDDDGNAEQTQP